jgi:hypothetical protein
MKNMLNGMFGPVAPGMCRISMSGKTAIKTSNGYKVYDVDKNRLTNCDSFVFDVGEDWFFVIPTNKVQRGDIILAGGKPRCVIEANKNEIKTLCYEDGTLETILPERHVFMGKQYFYGKIVSMFGNMAGTGKGMNGIFKYMMLSQMMNGGTGRDPLNQFGGGNNMLPMMMLMNGGNNFFDGMFDFDLDGLDEDTEIADDETDDEEA